MKRTEDSFAKIALHRARFGVLDSKERFELKPSLEAMASNLENRTNTPTPDEVVAVLRYIAKTI